MRKGDLRVALFRQKARQRILHPAIADRGVGFQFRHFAADAVGACLASVMVAQPVLGQAAQAVKAGDREVLAGQPAGKVVQALGPEDAEFQVKPVRPGSRDRPVQAPGAHPALLREQQGLGHLFAKGLETVADRVLV